MKDYFVASNPKCPGCGKHLDCASCPFEETAAPTPGDFTVCLCCGAIMRYTDDMQFKVCDKEDLEVAAQSQTTGGEDLIKQLLKVSLAAAPISKEIRKKDIAKN